MSFLDQIKLNSDHQTLIKYTALAHFLVHNALSANSKNPQLRKSHSSFTACKTN